MAAFPILMESVMKRIVLFLATNIAVMLVLGLLPSVLAGLAMLAKPGANTRVAMLVASLILSLTTALGFVVAMIGYLMVLLIGALIGKAALFEFLGGNMLGLFGGPVARPVLALVI